ncbi:MAG TPA: sulfotransferase [Gammaproteobacteria bacterium]
MANKANPKQPGIQDNSNDRPIIILGCARSGTTLTLLMLHSHPRIAIPPENRFLLNLYRRREKFGDLTDKKNRAELAKWIIDRKANRFEDLQLDAEKVRQMIIDGPPTIGSAAGIIFREYAAKHGKPRWGDKRPNYIREINTILEIFPDAQIIHCIRDGRDAAASLKKMPWWGKSFRATIYKWVESIEAGNKARASLRPDQYYELIYEKLVADPEAELRSLCKFLGEEFHPAMLEHHKTTKAAIPQKYLDAHYNRTQNEVDTKAVGKWAGELTPEQLALMEAVAAEQLLQYNYALSGSDVIPAKEKLKRYYQYAERGQKRAKENRKHSKKIAGKYKPPVQALLTTNQLKIYQDSKNKN